MSERRTVGRSVRRADALAKVTGDADYCVDLAHPDTLHAKVVRAERAHAVIEGIDASAALEMPGVVDVVTSSDLGGLFPRFGHIVADHPILAIERVRYWGEPVALVVAETALTAADAAEQVVVSYEDLPAAMTADEALAPDAPLLHEHAYESGDSSFDALASRAHDADRQADPGRSNVAHEVTLGWGDVDAAFAEAHTIVETTAHYPMLYAYAMEPYNALARFRDGVLEVHSTAQHPYMVREDLARIFRLPLAKVRVTAPFLGGGYGSKSYTKVEPLAAVGAWRTGRPVKLVCDIEESIYTTRADAARIWVRSGFDADGKLLVREFDLLLDSGAYADNSPLVLAKACNRCFGPYRIPNLRVHGRSMYTNTAPASSYRGFGAPQGNFAGELNIEQAADRLGLDGAKLRQLNLLERGEELLPGKRPLDADIKADLEMVTASLESGRPEHVRRYGMGFSVSASDAGAFPVSTAMVKILPDASVVLLTGATEMGQGSRTALAQIAAEELGVDFDDVTVLQSDTHATPYERTTGASRTTNLVGLAIQRACLDAREKVRSMAAEVAGVPVAEVEDAPGGVRLPDGTVAGFAEVLQRWVGSAAGEIVGHGLVRKNNDMSLLPPFWEIGCVGVAVDIDTDTGFVSMDQLVTVGDVGYAINPAAVEGQDLGAATQGMGAALYEELVYDGPHPVNPNVVDYRVPRTGDRPRRIDTMLAERGDGTGPYGAKGAGEGALNPMGAAIASAVARATGRWPDRLPLTPERVWRLLHEAPVEPGGA